MGMRVAVRIGMLMKMGAHSPILTQGDLSNGYMERRSNTFKAKYASLCRLGADVDQALQAEGQGKVLEF